MMFRTNHRRTAPAAGMAFAVLTSVVLASVALAPAALAQTSMGAAFGPWRIEDKCTAAAMARFPDHDAVSLKKRDDAIDTCFKANGLPVRSHPPSDKAQPNRVTPSE